MCRLRWPTWNSPSYSRSSRRRSSASIARRRANWSRRSRRCPTSCRWRSTISSRTAAIAESLGVDKVPAVAVVGKKDYGIRMFGIPSGYEFGSLIESIKLVSEGESGLSPETKKQVAKLTKPVKIQVFITPT